MKVTVHNSDTFLPKEVEIDDTVNEIAIHVKKALLAFSEGRTNTTMTQLIYTEDAKMLIGLLERDPKVSLESKKFRVTIERMDNKDN